MGHQRRLFLGLIACLSAPLVLSAPAAPVPHLSLAQIIERHIAARGGAAAWRSVQSMSWSGKMDAGVGDSAARSAQYVKNTWGHKGRTHAAAVSAAAASGAPASAPPANEVELPFVLDLKRPEKSRVEIVFAGKTAIQVFDGKQGWKYRPFLNRTDVEPFTAEEAKSQLGKWQLDGPLMDYASRGTQVQLEGVDEVENRAAYRLKLTLKTGTVEHIWIDAQSFLDVKIEGTPRRMDGIMHTVWVYQRDFHNVDGVMIPFVLETAVEGYPDTHKMVIEKAAVNPKFDDSLFTKPKV